MVLPIAFDGGATAKASIFVLTFIVYPFWGILDANFYEKNI